MSGVCGIKVKKNQGLCKRHAIFDLFVWLIASIIVFLYMLIYNITSCSLYTYRFAHYYLSQFCIQSLCTYKTLSFTSRRFLSILLVTRHRKNIMRCFLNHLDSPSRSPLFFPSAAVILSRENLWLAGEDIDIGRVSATKRRHCAAEAMKKGDEERTG